MNGTSFPPLLCNSTWIGGVLGIELDGFLCCEAAIEKAAAQSIQIVTFIHLREPVLFACVPVAAIIEVFTL